MSGRVVGIDLGTTNSEVAARTDEGIVVLTEGGTGILPSVVGISPDGRLLVGEEALNQLVLHPDRTVRSVKRLMGSAETVPMAGKRYRPQEISTMILSALKDRAERVLGEPVAGAVITVPAYFSDAQRQATREAGEIAGLKGPRKNNYGIRGPLHPVQPRCSSVETSKVAPSSRLAGRAHQRSPSCEVILARTLRPYGS